ncbi:hemagglutinin repeat-containing protein [Rhodoferax sp.]|uniref:two-partner secretion domain-containing protein n=1 Tax=Rhodoferax sp. TaxID=50421 RepID=UPI00374D4C2B
MNQQLYRLIFNRARGCLMAVAETATAQGKAGERSGKGIGPRTVLPSRSQIIAQAVASLCLLSAAQAQIISDGSAPSSQRPTVLNAGSGIPLVNIQTPSAAGVSRNTYSQFDVGRNGAILNNNRTNAQTQLRGWVQANPWLATGSARVILNEVNSSNPSQLRGAIEVAGQRAELIIANPAGIQIDGAGFINTSRAVLTTGTPIFSNGNLDGYRVERGTISITGAGLDASSTDATAILARAVEVNAGIWANALTVTTGANLVSADLDQNSVIAAAGAAPGFALDVSAIGGMYAGKISLVGTEAGLGVRNAGVIQANAGDLVLSHDGWLSNTGSLSASQNLTANTSGAVSNSGSMYANGNTALSAGGSISNTGLIAAQGDTTLSSSATITSASGSVLAAGLATDNTLGASGNLTLTAADAATLTGQSLAGANMSIAASTINVAGGQLNGLNLGLTASAGDITATGATLAASHTLTASTTQTLRTDGAALSAGQLNLAAHDLSNLGGQLSQTGTGDFALNLAGAVDNRAGMLTSNGKLLISASSLANAGGAVQSNGNLALSVSDLDNGSGNITAGGNLGIQATNVRNTGSLYASGQQTLVASGTVSNGGVIAALGNTAVTAQRLNSTSASLLAAGLRADGSLASAGDLSVATTQGLLANGQNIAAGSLHLDGASLDLSGSQTSGANLTLNAGAGHLNASHATLVASQTLTASSTQTLITDASTLSAHQLNLAANTLSNVGGQLLQTGTGNLALQFTGTLDNSQGMIASSSQNLTLSAQTLNNTGGQILHAGTGALSINASTAIDNTGGAIAGNGAATMATQSLRNQGGTVQTTGNLAIAATGLLDNSATGQINTGGDATLVSGSLDNSLGHITASGRLNASATGAITNISGLLAAIGDVSLSAASLDNRQGSIASVQNTLSLVTSGATTNDGGSIQAALDVTLSNTGLSNAGSDSRITGRNLSLDSHAQGFNNAGGTLVATQSAILSTGTLNNDGGLIQTGDALSIDTHGQALINTRAGSYTNSAGGINAQGALTLINGDLDNAAGFIGAGASVTASAAQVRNTAGGQIVSQSSIRFDSTGFDNHSGQVQAFGNVTINAGTGSIDNTAGLLRSANALTLAAHAVTNSNTQGSDQGIEGYNVAIAANTIANDTGAIRADNNATLSSSGNINNSQGLVSAGNTLTVQDLGSTKTLSVTNASGRQIALQALNFNAASLTGNGKMLSQGNLSIALTSDYNNTDEITANGNASISTTGNLTNSGTLQAGNTLALSASNIDNAASGKISATITQLTASNTLTNRGLIDGTDTQINAGTLNNLGTGRIYGDHISIAAGTLNNGAETVNGVTSAATIAARSRLDIGASNINNSNGALIFSAGDMAIGGSLDGSRLATGAANTLINSASTIQALGSLRISADTLSNLNPGFAYTFTTGNTSATQSDYIATNGRVYSSTDFTWVSDGLAYKPNVPSRTNCGLFCTYVPSPNGGELATSPYANPLYEAFYSGPNAYEPEYTYRSGGGHDAVYTTVPASFAYSASSSIWSTFGLPTPTTDTPAYPGMTCTGSGDRETCAGPTDAEIAAFEAAAQPWKDLQTKLDAFRAVAKTYMLSFKTYRDYTETSQSASVTASTPGQILSGGELTLNASNSALNDNSKIIAGGPLSVVGVAVNNRATEVTTTNTRNGSIHSWGVTGEDCSVFGCDATYGWINGSYTQNVASTLTLGTSLTQSYANASAPSTAIAGRGLVTSVSGVQVASNANVALLGLTNMGGNLQIAGTTPTSARAATTAPTSISRFTQVGTLNGVTVHSVLPNTSIPAASLFHTVPSITSHYLIETDPAFSNYRQWLSSDALLTALSYDPATVQKRLGDGFYEQQLIREQVAELTGRRFLTGYSSDEAQYQSLIASGVTYAKQWALVPGVALTAAQMASLTTDMVWLVQQTVTLADGSSQNVLVPQLYAVVRDGDLSNTGALLSGSSVNLNLTGDLTNTGTIAGRSVVALTTDNINNLGGRIAGGDVTVQAATDLNNIGGLISASNNLLATAGRDLNITTATQTRSTATGRYTGVDRVASLYVTGANGTLVAAAGRDMNLLGAAIGSAGTATLQAANNLNLQAVTQSESIDATRDADNYIRFSQSQSAGTTIQASNALTLSAGQDLTAVAATVNSTAGATTLAAGGNVNILSGRSTTSLATASFVEGSSAFGSGSTRTRDSASTDNAQGSSIGGSTVAVVAGKDITVSGSNVVSDAGTTLAAANNISIISDKNSSNSTSFFESKSSGLSLDGGLNYGNKQQSTDSQGNGDMAAAGTVAALTGNVTIVAGRQYNQVGSAVQTPAGNITIQAQDVAITEARETSASSTVTNQSSSGFTLAITSPLISAAQTGMQMVEAGSETSDKRMQALAAVNVGLAGYNAMQSVAQSGGTPGVNATLSYGTSSSTSTTTNLSNAAAGSTVAARGNISIVATGANLTTSTGAGNKVETPLQGNILVQGSTVSAGDTTTLKANNDILLQASQNTSSEHSSSKSSSASIGVGFGSGGFNVSASASKSKGQGDGADLTYTNTAVSGGQVVSLQSGRDTLLAGAAIAANAVNAEVGRDLFIQSLQDQSSYHSSSSSMGGSITIGTAMSASASMSKTKVDSDFLSVGTQSGIRAGDGGFQVDVKGNTTLTGGVISSTQAAVDAGVNSFATGGALTLTDIQNQASYSAQSVSVSVGTSGGAAPGFGNASDRASSETQAGISGIAGYTAARTGDKETGIQSIFDKDKVTGDVQAQVQITQAFFQQAPMAVANYAASQMQPITDANKYERLKDGQKNGTLSSDEQRQLSQMEVNGYTADKATADLNNPQYKTDYETWKEGGLGRVLAHTAIGALGGGISGALGAATVAEAAPTLNELQANLQTSLTKAGLPASVAQGLTTVAMQGLATGIGAVVSGGSVAGATAALGVDANNRQLHPDETKWIKDNAKTFAKQLGIAEAEAEKRLAQQAFREVQFGAEGQTDASAQAFLKTAGNQLLPGDSSISGQTVGYMFKADPIQKASADMYASAVVNSPDTLAFYAKNGITQPTMAQIQAASTKDANTRQTWSNATLGAAGLAATVALPPALSWCLSNPIACNRIVIAGGEIAAGDALGPTGLAIGGAAAGKAGLTAIKSAEEANAAMRAIGKEAAWSPGTAVITAELQPGTKVQMVMTEAQFKTYEKTGVLPMGGWATFDDVASQTAARQNLALLSQFKSDVKYVIEYEVIKPLKAEIGFVGKQTESSGQLLRGGATQAAFERTAEMTRTDYLKLTGRPKPLPFLSK